MSGDDDEDGSDWLSGQFDATGQVPAQPVPAAPAPAPATPTPATPTPDAVPPPTVPFAPAPASAPAAPVASAPEPNASGGFNWGLKPGGSVVEPPPAVIPAAVTPPAVVPPAAVAPPAAVIPPMVVTPPPAATPPPLVVPPVPTPSVGPPTEPYVSEPTKPLSWDEFASTQQQSAPVAPTASPVEQPTEAYTVQPWQPTAVTPPAVSEHSDEHSDDPHDPTSAIDSLFGDHKFQDYQEVGVLQTIQVPPTPTVVEPTEVVPREPLSSTQKALMGVAAGLIAALILVGLFFLGQHLGTAAAATPVTKPTGSAASATPTPAGTGGPVAPGARQWSTLQGGECIQPFTSAWAVSFTVVACSADHDAEMVFKGTLPASSDASYPSASAFQKEITPLCSASTAINYPAAVSVTDLQVSFSYPPNTSTWLKGDRTYYCFVDRVSGGNLPGDLSVPKTN